MLYPIELRVLMKKRRTGSLNAVHLLSAFLAPVKRKGGSAPGESANRNIVGLWGIILRRADAPVR